MVTQSAGIIQLGSAPPQTAAGRRLFSSTRTMSTTVSAIAAVITQTKSEQGPGKKARQWVARANTIKTCRDRGEIVVKKIPGDSNPADLGTKPVLPTAQYERLVGMCMGLPDGRMVGETALAGAHVVGAGAGAGLEAGVT